jgi:PAS domain S-box-containing protein
MAPPGLREAYADAFSGTLDPQAEEPLGRVVTVPARRKDESQFTAEMAISGVSIHGRRHRVAIVRDVTWQRETTQMLMQERILLRTLVDALPDCIYAKDRKAHKTLANQADVRSLGFNTETEVLGKTDYEMLDRKTAAACFADDMRVVTHGEPVLDRQELILNAKGEQRWLETTKLPLRDEMGNIVGLVGVGHDITERR